MPTGVYERTKPVSKETREKIRQIHLGTKRNEKQKENIRQGILKSYADGRKLSSSCFPCGEKHPNWKGGLIYNKKYINWQKSNNTRRKRFLNKQGLGHTFQEWEDLKEKYNYTCPCCKKSEPEIKLTIDHILPLIKMGTNEISNIQPLCGKCNRSKYVKTIKY
jgi:5-methylcytosine-specific restriction endonuclease McrA